MSYWHPNSQPSQPPWHPDRDTEHRLTVLEVRTDHHAGHHAEHFEDTVRQRARLNLHERLILILAGGLSVVLQDKFPTIVGLLRGLSH